MLPLFRRLMPLFAIDALMSDHFFLFFLGRVVLLQLVENACLNIILINLLHQRLYGVEFAIRAPTWGYLSLEEVVSRILSRNVHSI